MLGKAWVSIRANLDPLKRGLARAKDAVKRGMASMARLVKIGAAAIAVAMTAATVAALKQERAEVRLAAALKVANEYTEEGFADLKQFAAQLQTVTTYGDEVTLALMQLGKSLGVQTKDLKTATKMAIGLASALGRDANSMMMYSALALQGEFTMLRRYIPALRKTEDEAEQLAIIMKTAAKGLGIEMKMAAETGGGALSQIWAIIGDISEKFGSALIPMMIEFRDKLAAWVQTNGMQIQEWADTFARAV